ncbi:MAG TPA: FecR domain-containing protein [Burkholderiales bacterium]|nr:FecR domain-containing protein [Burkholderiales bacterium]HUK04905.1 FecR domain-containing protein [Burkholderiales bacterium]
MLRPAAIVLLFLAQFACAQAASPDAGDRSPAGAVTLVEGDVRFLDAKQQARRPKVGDPIYEGEGVVTGTDGEVHFDMLDGGYIGVRPGTKLNIVNFKAEGGPDDSFLLNLLEGSFRAVTGWITGSSGRRAEVQTPTATIGVRGTDYEPLVIPEGSKTGEAGTYNRVNIGETEMRTAQGSVIVKPNQAGFVPRRGTVKPRLLDRVPAFFRPTRNEKRFEGLHQRIHQNLEQKRQLRIKQVQQRKLQRAKAAPAQKAAAEQRREQFRQRQEAQKQQRLQEAQKREAQAQRQAQERRALKQDQARAAKKAGVEERRKRRFEKRE